VRIPDDAFVVQGRTARLHLVDLPIVDSFQFLGASEVAATVSLDVTWTATGRPRNIKPGSLDPTDFSSFAGEFRNADADGSFAGSEAGFSFHATDATSDGAFAEFGTERNGLFLRTPPPASAPVVELAPGPPEESQIRPALLRALPNPAITGAAVEFTLEAAGPASVEVFDLAGRRIVTLLDERFLPAGQRTVLWDLRDASGERVPAGTYLVRWKSDQRYKTVRLAVIP